MVQDTESRLANHFTWFVFDIKKIVDIEVNADTKDNMRELLNITPEWNFIYEIYRFCLYVFYISQPVWLYIYE